MSEAIKFIKLSNRSYMVEVNGRPMLDSAGKIDNVSFADQARIVRALSGRSTRDITPEARDVYPGS